MGCARQGSGREPSSLTRDHYGLRQAGLREGTQLSYPRPLWAAPGRAQGGNPALLPAATMSCARQGSGREPSSLTRGHYGLRQAVAAPGGAWRMDQAHSPTATMGCARRRPEKGPSRLTHCHHELREVVPGEGQQPPFAGGLHSGPEARVCMPSSCQPRSHLQATGKWHSTQQHVALIAPVDPLPCIA